MPPPTTAAVTTDRSITALRFRTRSRSFALAVGIGRAASGQFSCNSDTGSLRYVTIAPRSRPAVLYRLQQRIESWN